MILVDTSVMIDFLKGKDSEQTNKLVNIIQGELPFGINPFIYQEILQGVSGENDYKLLKKYLDTQRFYYLQNGNESYANAALMYFKCRKEGITIRNSIDVIIALTAIENSLFLLHNDNDFYNIQKVFSKLIFY